MDKDEAQKLHKKILGKFPRLQWIKVSKAKPVNMDVNVQINIDYSAVECRVLSTYGIPSKLMQPLPSLRGGKTAAVGDAMKRAVVDQMRGDPKVASWYPKTEAEVDAEYQAIVADGYVNMVHDSITLLVDRDLPDVQIRPLMKTLGIEPD